MNLSVAGPAEATDAIVSYPAGRLPAMTTALMLIDAQRNMLEGGEAIPDASRVRPSLESLLTRARSQGVAVVHVQNDGPAGSVDEPHTEGWELVLPPADGEIVVRKDQFDTFTANPALADHLRALGVARVVVAGMQSEYCVLETGRSALGLGFEVVLAAGAHGTYDDDSSAADISAGVEKELSGSGAMVRPYEQIRFAGD